MKRLQRARLSAKFKHNNRSKSPSHTCTQTLKKRPQIMSPKPLTNPQIMNPKTLTHPQIRGRGDAVGKTLGQVAVLINGYILALVRVGVEAYMRQVKNMARGGGEWRGGGGGVGRRRRRRRSRGKMMPRSYCRGRGGDDWGRGEGIAAKERREMVD